MAILRKWQVPHPMVTIKVEHSREIWSKTTAWAELPASDPTAPSVYIRIFFGEISDRPNVTGWSRIGTNSKSYRQNADLVHLQGGNEESSMVLSDAAHKTAPMDKEKKGLENRASCTNIRLQRTQLLSTKIQSCCMV